MGKISKAISKILCGVLIIGAVAGSGSALYFGGKNNGWFDEFKKPDTEQSQPDNNETNSTGGAVLDEVSNKGVKLACTMLTTAEYDEYGIFPLAETAYTLTATVSPTEVTDKTVDWSVAWKNPASSWATGKTVTNYVTVTPISGETQKATVACLGAFGEQIIVTATSCDNPDASGTCAVDYVQKVSGLTFALGDVSFTNGDKTTADFDIGMGGMMRGKGGVPKFGCNLSDTYTIAEEVTFNPITIQIGYHGSLYSYKRVINSDTTTRITFDRSFFVKESGCEMNVNGIEITAQNFSSYSSNDFSSFVDFFNNCFRDTPNIVFSVETKYGGTINFSSTLLFSVVNSTNVTGVNLDKSGIRF